MRNVIALFYFVGSENPCIYSVPNRKQSYDDNWVVTVNGEEVQPSALFGGLLGVSLPQGDCTVTLRYTHPGVVPGAAASLAALAAALVWWFAERGRSQNA